MADTSRIEWTDSTFNPWIGCTKVSPACDHCYAAVSTPARALGVTWGAGHPRRRTSPANWKEPLRWNARPFWQCEACGWRGEFPATDGTRMCPACAGGVSPARRRVFCASLADVFDNAVPDEWRVDLWELIARTPNLDWLLLTKRIGNAERMLPVMDSKLPGYRPWNFKWPWSNVWLGATICNQAEADRDIPKLLAVPATVRFLSMEPLLGPVELERVYGAPGGTPFNALCAKTPQGWPRCVSHVAGHCMADCQYRWPAVDWVIAGGESGPSARPMHRDWVRSLRDQCAAAGVPFLFKQWGEWAGADASGATVRLTDPISVPHLAVRCGKKAAGRHLDGRLHTAFPEVRHA